MSIMKFSHIALRVSDIHKMLQFYCNGLGLEEAFRIKNDDDSLRIVYIHISNGQYLELCLGGTERLPFDDQKNIGMRHICFTVESLDKTKKLLEQRGIIFDSEIIKMRDRNLAAYLFDPEGNKIEMVEVVKDSPQYIFENSSKE